MNHLVREALERHPRRIVNAGHFPPGVLKGGRCGLQAD